MGAMLFMCIAFSRAQDQLLPVFHFRTLEGFKREWVTSRVVRDSMGYVWIGTQNGLRRYDGHSYKEYRNVPADRTSISSNRICSLLLDRQQRLWVGTLETGLSLYDRRNDTFINFFPHPDDSTTNVREVFEMTEGRSNCIWLGTSDGVVRVEIAQDTEAVGFGKSPGSLRFKRIPITSEGGCAYDVLERSDGTLIVATNLGLRILDPSAKLLSPSHLNGPLGSILDTTCIYCLGGSTGDRVWIGTERYGLFHVDWATHQVQQFAHSDFDGTSISMNEIWDLEEDGSGNLWVATQKGVDLFSRARGRCVPYLTYGPRPDGCAMIQLSYDPTGTFWVSTWSNVYRLSLRSKLFSHFSLPVKGSLTSSRSFQGVQRASDGTEWVISEDKLFQLAMPECAVKRTIDIFKGKRAMRLDPNRNSSMIDAKGILWYAAWDLGLYKINLQTGSVRNYSYQDAVGRPTTLRTIAQGTGDSLWVGAQFEGLMRFDPISGIFHRVGPPKVGNLTWDNQGKIWVATEGLGMYIYDPATGAEEYTVHLHSDSLSLSHDLTWDVYEDPQNRIWVGAGNVINLWDPHTRKFTRYSNPGFPDAAEAHPIGSDHKGRLWVRHDKGLSILDPSTGMFSNYDASDGLCFRVNDMEVLEDGQIILTGSSGINLVSPDVVDKRYPPPPLLLTRMTINDIPVVPPSSPNGSAGLELSYKENVIEFEFAAMDLDAPERVRYQYQLQGLDKDWVKPEGRQFVRYASLPPGDYVFMVRAAPLWGEWPGQEIALAVRISPPWWKTGGAYAAYGTLFLLALYGGYRVRLRQLRLQQAAEIEHFQAEHLAHVDRLKSRFFSNISHEFRTPLTLILGPTEQAMQVASEPLIGQKLRLIRDNAKKLLALVNQLLDFSRLEAGMMKLQVSPGDIMQHLRRVTLSFESWAERKQIILEFHSEPASVKGYFDADKLEKIMNNLLSNAMKFTGEGGKVQVNVRIAELRADAPCPPLPPSGSAEGERKREGEWATISVADSGCGIPPEQLPHIFERFYRVDDTHTTEGTGIGLALTKELVELHHGTIKVESSPGSGSVFTVCVPIEEEAYQADEITTAPVQTLEREQVRIPGSSVEPVPVPSTEPNDDKPRVLIVEDNADLRSYIKEFLEGIFVVREARDGKEGCEQALEMIPDLVISDVMMPAMNGIDLCRTLKQDVRTSHVPIILLTARAGTESKIEGLEFGADDYVTKPFDTKELIVRARNLVEQRRELRRKFSAGAVLKPGDITVSSLDDTLLQKAMVYVEQNIDREDLGVDDLAQELSMSRATLHRKIKAITNLAPVEFIRYLRLQRARCLLEQNAGTIAEVAYQVGFQSPSYFTASFHQLFGVLPSEVLRKS